MSIGVTEILSACKRTRKVTMFEPFLEHFSDIDYACVLSEVCVRSGDALQLDPGGNGWFGRTYEQWETLTGIPATQARKVCLDLAEQKYIEHEIRGRSGSHFRAVPESIARLVAIAPRPDSGGRETFGICPECGNFVIEGTRSYLCASWRVGEVGCRFCLWKDTLSRNGKNEVTADEVRLLLAGQEIELKNLVSFKTGRIFSCKGRLHKRDTGKYGIKYIFPERKKRGCGDAKTEQRAADRLAQSSSVD